MPNATKTGCYCELFLGSGAVAFEYMKQRKPCQIILNDKESRLIKVFEALQSNCEEFQRRLKYRWAGSEEIMNCVDDLDYTVKWFLENQLTTYFTAGVLLKKNFEEQRKLLDKNLVIFLRKDWEDALKAVLANRGKVLQNNTSMIIYADPPYDGTRTYKSKFDLDNFLEEMNKIKELKKLFIFISLNATEKVLAALEGWHRKELFKFKKTKKRKARSEMLFSNRVFKNYNNKEITEF